MVGGPRGHAAQEGDGRPVREGAAGIAWRTYILRLAETIDTVVVKIGNARKEHADGHRAWIHTLDHLDEARGLLDKLAKAIRVP